MNIKKLLCDASKNKKMCYANIIIINSFHNSKILLCIRDRLINITVTSLRCNFICR